jgi:hypothetical protein
MDIVELEEDADDTVRLIVVECEMLPDVPVIVSWYVPGAAEEAADIVRVDEAATVLPEDGVTEDGLKVAVTPAIGGK